jgi:hypothetical protein
VAYGAVQAGAVVETDVVLQEALPLLWRRWADAVLELSLDGALDLLHTARPDASSPPSRHACPPTPDDLRV